ncbi:MAG: hypothetical protein LBQ48_05945 [Oscillospiraceae bacterium]|jgi:hypothetical protein|nr:hypothetical protein [Oscillospiraceae bacterium]
MKNSPVKRAKAVVCVLLGLMLVISSVISSSAFDRSQTSGVRTSHSEQKNKWDDIEQKAEVIRRNPNLYHQIEGMETKAAEVTHDRYSRVFLTESGKFITRIYSDPLTYTDVDGKARDAVRI